MREKSLEVHKVLDDSENKNIMVPLVKAWLGDLRDLAYDVDNVLDEFNYHLMRRKLVAKANGEAAH